MVLVGCDGCESGLLENKRLIVFLRVFLTVLAGVHVDDMKPRLIPVHGVQDDLQEQECIVRKKRRKKKKNRPTYKYNNNKKRVYFSNRSGKKTH